MVVTTFAAETQDCRRAEEQPWAEHFTARRVGLVAAEAGRTRRPLSAAESIAVGQRNSREPTIAGDSESSATRGESSHQISGEHDRAEPLGFQRDPSRSKRAENQRPERFAFPSSLPDPPHIKKRRDLTWKERYLVLKEASRLYAASWVRDIGPELRPNDYKRKEESEDKLNGGKGSPAFLAR
ncbi:hypothetical protein STAS_04208, partial [Striga asiatica]